MTLRKYRNIMGSVIFSEGHISEWYKRDLNETRYNADLAHSDKSAQSAYYKILYNITLLKYHYFLINPLFSGLKRIRETRCNADLEHSDKSRAIAYWCAKIKHNIIMILLFSDEFVFRRP